MNANIDRKPNSGRLWPLAGLAIAASAVPLGILAAIGGYMLGLVLIATLPVVLVLVGIFAAIDRLILDSKVRRLIAQRNLVADRATVVGARTVTSIEYLGRPFSVEISDTSGTCPLRMNSGFAWKVGADGTLSSPMCAPAAAAVRRITRAGVASGTSDSCKCPLGRNSARFRAYYA